MCQFKANYCINGRLNGFDSTNSRSFREIAADRKIEELEQKLENPDRSPVQVLNGDDSAEEEESNVTTTGKCNSDPVVQMKLDTIKLPYFKEDLTEWIPFKELFLSLVHKNKNMDDSVRFLQLSNHSRGAALDTIRGYQPSGVNYKAAWNDLKKRFDRKGEIVQEYIRKFLEVPAITSKSTYFNP
jgi:Protein of unknown function (DUF1759)